MTTALPDKILARNRYWAGYSLKQISELLPEVNYATIFAWKKSGEWDKADSLQKIEGHIETRYLLLMAKEDKTDADFKELDAIGKELERAAKIRRYESSGNGAELNPKLSKRRKGKKIPGEKKNCLNEEQVEQLNDAFTGTGGLFGYQKTWLQAKNQPVRNILKSRQIGATWYFARESLLDAVNTGDNQIFLSASKAQAHVFKGYILDFVLQVTGVELRGDPIRLWNGATLYFLGTNSKTAQSYHGHLYMDEYFWIGKFQELQKVASGMAIHKKWRETYFSTPSTTTHQAYAFWTGKHYNRGRRKKDHISIDVNHSALRAGKLCTDGQWRQAVTVEDAIAGGCDLFDLAQLRNKYSELDYNNLLMCQFIDDTLSVFTLKSLERCMVDSWEKWTDFKPLFDRPFAYRPVWIGYDPSRSRDDASLVVVAPPAVAGGKYRVLEKRSFNGMSFEGQAREIKAVCDTYNVEYLAIDTTGIGAAVFELVTQYYPTAVAITYTVEIKNRLVLKTQSLVDDARLEYDSSWNDLTLQLMTVCKEVTPSGRQVSYQTSRSEETGHGDLAWALMNALDRMEYSFHDDAAELGASSQSFLELC